MARRRSSVDTIWPSNLTGGLMLEPGNKNGGMRVARDVVYGQNGRIYFAGVKRHSNMSPHLAGTAFTLAYAPRLLRSDVSNLAHFRTADGTPSAYAHLATASFAPTTVGQIDTTIRSAGAGYTTAGMDDNWSCESGVVTIGRELLVPANIAAAYTRPGIRWAGLQATSGTAIGATLSTTLNGRTVTAGGATFAAGDVGKYLRVRDGAACQRRWYLITKYTSATSVEVDQPMPATSAGVSGDMQTIGAWLTTPGTFANGSVGTPLAQAGDGDNLVSADVACQHDGRVFVGSVQDMSSGAAAYYPERIRWSGTPADGGSAAYPEFKWYERFELGAYQDIFPGEGGERITALASYGGVLFVFKQSGVFAVTGGTHVDGIDVGISVSKITTQDGVQYQAQVCVTPDGIVFAGRSGVWLLNQSGLTSLTDGRIASAYKGLGPRLNVLHVSYLPDTRRIVVTANTGSMPFGVMQDASVLVYQLDVGAWTTQGVHYIDDSNQPPTLYVPAHSNIVTLRSGGEFASYELSVSYSGDVSYPCVWSDWAYDYSIMAGVTHAGTPLSTYQYVIPYLVTNDVPLDSDRYSYRPRMVLVDGYVPLSPAVEFGVNASTKVANPTTGGSDYMTKVRVSNSIKSRMYLVMLSSNSSSPVTGGHIRRLGVEVVRVNRRP